MGPKKKNRHLDDWEKDFEALDDNGDLKEPEVPVKPAGKSKKKAQKKGKKAAAFASDDDEDVPAPALAKSPEPSEKDPSEEEEQEEASEEEDVPAVKPKGGRKKAPAFSFALLGGDDDDEEEEEEEEEDEEEEEEPPRQPVAAKVVSIKAHPKADKLRIVKLAAGPLLGDLQVVTNAPNLAKHQVVALAPPGSTTPGSGVDIAVTKLRGVESSGMICSAFDLGWSEAADGLALVLPKTWAPGTALPAEIPEELRPEAEEEPAAALEDEAAASKKKKKKASSKKAFDADSLFAALGDEPAGDGAEAAFAALTLDEASAADGVDGDVSFGKSKKKSKKKAAADIDLDALLAGEPEPAAEPELAAEPEPAPAPAPKKATTAKPAKKGGKKGAASKEEDAELDALLAEIDAPAKAPEPPKGKKGGKGKKGAAAKAQDEDLDAILAELGMEPAAAPAPEPAAPEPEAAREPAPAAPAESAPAEPAAEGQDGAPGASKKKKKKGKKAAAEGEEAAAEAGESPDKAAGKGGKPKKVSAAVRRMQEALEAQRRAAEEAERAAEEERLREEEERRREEEEARRKEEEVERKRAERKAQREQLKREGKLLTGKAKAEADRLARVREQLLKQAGIDVANLPAAKKPVYGSRRKPNNKNRRAPEKEEEKEKEEAEEEQAVAQEEVKEEPAVVEQPEEEVVVEEAPEPAAPESWEAAVDDWDALDEDSVAVPGQPQDKPVEEVKKEEEPGVEAETAEPQEAEAEPEAEESESGSEEESEEESEDESEDSSDSDSESSSASSSSEYSSSSDSEMDSDEEMAERVAAQQARRAERRHAALAARRPDDLRSPICCILGHVDTGKTKILDNIRRTNVQDGEAGGITQQIGATYVPGDAIMRRTEELRQGRSFDLKVPGLLVIDTPGHESFSNLRSRGSGLCDIAVLVVDLMHGLEQQTIESLNLLRMRKTPFVIALNKVDRLYGWRAEPNRGVQAALAAQDEHARREFERRVAQISLQLNEQGLNVALYWKNRDPRTHVSIVPTSAHTGEGIPDLLQILVKLTQTAMSDRLMFVDDLQCTVLEVKSIEGLGTTVDVVLINGQLKEGDTIVACGLHGAIVTTARALLTPQPLREMRVKGSYVHHKSVRAAMGVKIAAHDLETAVAGTQLFVAGPGDDLEALKAEVMEDMQDIFASVDKTGEGVCVQASTLGSLEALLTFLRTPEVNIPVSAINIGPVHKRDVMRANVMIERGFKKFGCILAFDVPVTREARDLAEDLGVTVFTADIIYHLFDQFTAYLKRVKEEEQEAARLEAVFPCVLRILPECVFNKKAPIVVGVEVAEGIAKVGAPLCVPSQGGFELGRIASMEKDHKPVDTARQGDHIAMKIEATNPDQAARLYGRHFDYRDDLISKISRKSINILKDMFREEMTKDDWRLVIRLKKVFNID